MVDLHDVLEGQRFEVQSVGSVVVSRHGLWVTVNHHCLIPDTRQLQSSVNTGVVELNTLANTVRPRTENDNFLALVLWADFASSTRIEFVGRVVIRSFCLELCRAGVDGLKDWMNAKAPPQTTNTLFTGQFWPKCSNLSVREPPVLCLTQQIFGHYRGIEERPANVLQVFHFGNKPWIQTGGLMNLFDATAEALRQFNIVNTAFGWALEVF